MWADGAKQLQEVSPVTGRALAIASSAPSTIRPVTMCERMLAGKVQVVEWCSSEMSQAQRVRGEERIVIMLEQLASSPYAPRLVELAGGSARSYGCAGKSIGDPGTRLCLTRPRQNGIRAAGTATGILGSLLSPNFRSLGIVAHGNHAHPLRLVLVWSEGN